MTLTNQATKVRLGLLGAGRLGKAIAGTWFKRTGEGALVWSRSGPRLHNDAEMRIAEGTWVDDWTGTLAAKSVAIAMPGRALLELAEGNEQATQFTGNIFSAAASLSLVSLRRVFPHATILCIAPFLIDGVNSIPMLVLRPSDLRFSQWENAKAELEVFGDVDVVDDEAIFAQVSLLGAPWPVVVLAAMQAAASAGVEGVQDEAAIKIGRRIFLRAMQSLLQQQSSGEVATPGGITERGLTSLGNMTSFFKAVFDQMRARADELKM